MPKYTSFSSKWLHKVDSTGKPCSVWLRQGKEKSTFICTVCNIELSCANGGWTNVKNHFERPKHLQCLKDVLESGQLVASTVTLSSTRNNTASNQSYTSSFSSPITNNPSFMVLNNSTDRALTHEEKITRAECYWAMATAQLGFSYDSSQNIPELFASMFPDSKVAADYAMKDRKLSYVVSHGTGYFFIRELIKDVLKAPAYSLLFDETTIVGVRKQLDLHIRYWSEYQQGVVTRYWKSIMLGHATADIISHHLLDSLKYEGLDLSKLLHLGRDNPNVNKAVEAMIEKEVRSAQEKKTGNSSSNGLLPIGPCPLHIIHNAFKRGFTQNDWQIEDILYDFCFFFSRSSVRREDYLKVVETIGVGVGRFMKRFVITRWIEVDDLLTNKTVKQLLSISFDSQANEKPDSKLEIGEITRNELQEMPTNEKIKFMQDVRDIYKTIARELTRTLPVTNNFLQNLQFMHPLQRHHESSSKSLMIIARDLPQLLSDDDLDYLNGEWRLYENETIPEEWYQQKTTSGGSDEILLSLSHGNADVERGFSENAALITDDRSSLSDISINGLRATKDAVKFYGQGKVHEVPICKGLLDNVKEAHSRCQVDQERKQRILKEKEAIEAAAKLTKNKELILVEKEQNLIDQHKILQEDLENASKMLNEGNSRLEAAVATKNFAGVEMAQLLIGGAKKKLDVLKTQLGDNTDQMNQLRKKLKK
ncbi:unnamed protein product [Rotaria magnacalcarata]|uniref:Uncharacterized protein n=1 Tax=Rotaria magnacalcarata TaxID=392030 RepID=A0A819WPL1_9BILA|nr:unnamed protein product [Rotaria magnacalcarata]